MGRIHTDLDVHVTILNDYMEGRERLTRYHLQYFPSRLVYTQDLKSCNEIVNDYAFKVSTANTIAEVCEIIKELYKKTLSEDYMRVNVLFEAIDIAHLSNEYRHDSNARIILDKKCISYNHEISEEDRKYILHEMLEFRKYNSLKNC